MLSIKYVHKRIRLFRIELSFMMLVCLVTLMFLWQLLIMLSMLSIFK